MKNYTIIVALIMFALIVSQVPGAFSEQQTNATVSIKPPLLGPPVSAHQVYWNGSAWATLSGENQTSTLDSMYQGVANITLLNIPEMNVTFPNQTEVENALAFFSNVLDLNMTHYSVELMPSGPANPADAFSSSNSNIYENAVAESFILFPTNAINSTDGTLDIACNVIGDRVFYLDIVQTSAKMPFFTHSMTSTQDQISELVDRYANYSGDSSIQDIKSAIETYGIAGSSQEAIGNSTLDVNTYAGDESNPYLTLIRAPEGINNTYDNIILWYQNGIVRQLIDLWNRVPIGSFAIDLTQAEAVQIAEQAVRDYSFSYGNTTYSNFTISNAGNAVLTNLQMQPRNGSLYPLYGISLGLSHMFGGISELQVGVWADTGQVAGVNWVGSYGGSSSITSTAPFNPSSASHNLKPNNSDAVSTSTYIIVAVVSFAVVVAISAVILKKRNMKLNK